MKAVILAAGTGTRLHPLTHNCPKCLVAVEGKRLIDYQLDALRAVGVEDIVLVVGYEADQIRRYCGDMARYIENLDYQTTNSIYSLHLAADELDVDTFLFNCDIVFHPQILRRMLDSGYPSVVAVDSHVKLIEGEMNVAFDGGQQISAISKKLDPAQAQAQSMQLVKFDAAGAVQVQQEVERLVFEQQKNAFPTSAYGPLIQVGSLYAVEGGDLPWGEIDSLEDFDRVETEVAPRLNGI
jgi:choline kinase